MSKPKTTKNKIEQLLEELEIEDTPLVKSVSKSKRKYNTVMQNIPMMEDYNFMADLLFLPETKEGFKYLFVVVDIANQDFDIEAIKDKKPTTTLKALKTIFKRKYLDKPYASFKTDGGTEFKGVFHKYLVDENILHKSGLPGRHRYTSVVERLNKELVKFFNLYMNSKEIKTGKIYKEWTDILPQVREKLNNIRKIKLLPQNKYKYEAFSTTETPKFKVGDMVHRILDEPRNALNEKQSTNIFRVGDFTFSPIPNKIKQIVYFSGDPAYRYLLEGIQGVSYAGWELIPNTLKINEEVYEIKEIIDISYNRKEKMWYYRIQMFGESKKDSGWYSRVDLLKTMEKDKLEEFIDLYKSKLKKKK